MGTPSESAVAGAGWHIYVEWGGGHGKDAGGRPPPRPALPSSLVLVRMQDTAESLGTHVARIADNVARKVRPHPTPALAAPGYGACVFRAVFVRSAMRLFLSIR